MEAVRGPFTKAAGLIPGMAGRPADQASIHRKSNQLGGMSRLV